MTPQELVSTVDGLPVRDSGPWAKEKLYYVSRYMSIFNGGMKKIWPKRALASDPPFQRLVFVEADAPSAIALRERTATAASRRVLLEGDCNAASTISEIRRIVGGKILTLCFVDNLGLNVTFSTIRSLADGNRPIDFVFTFQVSDLTRNIDEALSGPGGDRFDAFFGSSRWRDGRCQ